MSPFPVKRSTHGHAGEVARLLRRHRLRAPTERDDPGSLEVREQQAIRLAHTARADREAGPTDRKSSS